MTTMNPINGTNLLCPLKGLWFTYFVIFQGHFRHKTLLISKYKYNPLEV